MKLAIFVSIAFLLLLQALGFSDTIYVDALNTSGPWDGSQTNPYQYIQDGIDAALGGDTVLVLSGVYYENIDFLGKAITLTSDMGPYLTTIDGSQSGSCVVFITAEAADSVIDGFTLTNGSGTYNGGGPDLYNGAGIYCVGSNPTIINNIIADNVTIYDGMGGGICCENYASPLIKNNTIINNFITPESASDYISGGGGGVACLTFSDPLVTENVISGNSAAYSGGGVFCINNAAPTVSYNLISNNYSGYAYGGGVFCKEDAAPTVTNNIISGNFSEQWGGGVYSWQSLPVVTYNQIYDNVADSGGGIYFYDNSSSLIKGNVIYRNTVLYDGGGIWTGHSSSPDIEDNIIHSNTGTGITCFNSGSPLMRNNLIYNNNNNNSFGGGIYCANSSSPTITNCTVTANTGSLGGGIFINVDCTIAITNTILWKNTAPEGTEIWLGDSAEPSILTISHSDVWDGLDSVHVESGSTLNWGTNMIDSPPGFVNPVIRNYHLAYNSFCIDIGSTSAPGLPAFDPDGDARSSDGDADGTAVPDIGWDEFAPLIVPFNYTTIQDAIDSAADGNTIIVCPGEYMENINFKGKAIHMISRSGREITTINGGQQDAVVVFDGNEGLDTILRGFTIINGNSSDGGGIRCDGASPLITANEITGNMATYGSGVHCMNAAAPVLTNNVIEGNFAQYGAGLCSYGAFPIVTNNTLLNNAASLDGGGISSLYQSNVKVTNTILWGNSAATGSQIYIGDTVDPSIVTISYSDVEGGQTGAHVETYCILNWNDGMIDAEPEMVDMPAGDYHLLYTSPCRDTGTENALKRPDVDFDGNPRTDYSNTDIGADEFSRYFYITGDKVPEGDIEGKLVGTPGTAQVGLWFAFSVLNPPLPSAFGPFYLAPPTIGPLPLFPIPASGVEIIPTRLPLDPSGPYDVPMQAIIGTEFTALYILHVQ
ncbi:MAG: right-handed parallel beta-helix repeat-containing protein [Planctomycetota bacterium]|jgi:parallel beta-helix repeat protein